MSGYIKLLTNTPASALSSSNYFGWPASQAFDGITTTGWAPSGSVPAWVGYDFETAVDVGKVRVLNNNGYGGRAAQVQGSSDGTSWITVYSGEIAQTGWTDFVFTVASYRYWRLYITSLWAGGGPNEFELEFYQEYVGSYPYACGIKIDFDDEILSTINADVVEYIGAGTLLNLPTGIGTDYTVVASSYWNASYAPAKAFDGNLNTRWHSAGTASGEWLGITFPTAKAVASIAVSVPGANRPRGYKVQASNDGTTWIDKATGELLNETSDQTVLVAGVTAYTQWRLYFTSCWSTHYSIAELKFYAGEPLYHANGFSISSNEYCTSPEGAATAGTYKIKRVTKSEDNLSVIVWLWIPDRLKYPAGDITVAYSKASGSLAGLGGSQVGSFSLTFTPTNITLVFNPSPAEKLSATLTQDYDLIQIFYSFYQDPLEALTATLTQTNQVIHVNDIPQ